MSQSSLHRLILGKAIIAAVGIGFTQTAMADSDETVKEGFSTGFDYTLDITTVAAGGIKKGTEPVGLGNIKFDYNSEKWGWHSNIYLPHGEGASEELVGDFSGVNSNVDGDGAKPRLGEFWFEGRHGIGSARIGMLLLDDTYWVIENSNELFMNESFGEPIAISGNLPNPPTDPIAAFGIHTSWNIGEKNVLRAAVVDGDAGDPDEENIRGTEVKWREGELIAIEFERKLGEGEIPQAFKFGATYHTGEFIDFETLEEQNNWSVYSILEMPISENIGWFGRISYADPKTSVSTMSAQTGITIAEAFSSKGTFGAGISYVKLNDKINESAEFFLGEEFEGLEAGLSNETILELTYEYRFNEHFSLQPDLQYIFNAGGTRDSDDALVISLRGRASF